MLLLITAILHRRSAPRIRRRYHDDYAYDFSGEMVQRSESGTAENYVYDGQDLALVLNSSGGVIETELDGPAVDQVLASEDSSENVNWLLTDNQGSARDVVQNLYGTDVTESVDHLVYDGFGEISWQSSATDQPRFTYAGMRYDSAVSMYYDTQRWYDAVDAVFASQDPLGFGGGQTNTEAYVGNSPTNATDPTGEIGEGIATGLLGALVGGAWGGLTYAFAAQDNATPGGFWGAVAGGAVAGGMLGAALDPVFLAAGAAYLGTSEAGLAGAVGVYAAYTGGYTDSVVRQYVDNPNHTVDQAQADRDAAHAAPFGLLPAAGYLYLRGNARVGVIRPGSGSGEGVPVESSRFELNAPRVRNPVTHDPIPTTVEAPVPNDVLKNAEIALDNIADGTKAAWGGKWGAKFGNYQNQLPNIDSQLPGNNGITYKEYYLPKSAGDATKWGSNRLVVGSDGNVYVTTTHYGQNGGTDFQWMGKLKTK